MKAIAHGAYGSADHFTEVDLPMPELRKGEVRIRVKAISFNPVDYQIRRGQRESSHVRSSRWPSTVAPSSSGVSN